MKLKETINTQFLVDIGVLDHKLEVKNFETFMDIFNHPIYLKGWKDVPKNLESHIKNIIDVYDVHYGAQDYYKEFGLPAKGLGRDYIFRVYSSQTLDFIGVSEYNDITFDEWKYLLKHSSDLETFLSKNIGLSSEQKLELIEYCVTENPYSVRFLDETKSCYKMLCQMAVMSDCKSVKYIKTTDDKLYNELVIKACIYDNECRALEFLNRPLDKDAFNRICRLSSKHFKYAMNRLSDHYESDLTIEEFENYYTNDINVTSNLYRCTSIPIEYRQEKTKEYLDRYPKMLCWFTEKGMVDNFDLKVKEYLARNIDSDNLIRFVKAKLIEQGKV